ncbi:MAG: transposase [Acetanaerobacterium sp.]
MPVPRCISVCDVLNSSDQPYTNGFTEGVNNKVKILKRNPMTTVISVVSATASCICSAFQRTKGWPFATPFICFLFDSPQRVIYSTFISCRGVKFEIKLGMLWIAQNQAT